MITPNTKLVFLLAALTCAGLTGFSFYLQYIQALDPCPLCLSQRMVVLLLGGVTLLAALYNPTTKSVKIYSAIVIALGFIGIALASRQLWVQHLPPSEVPSCMPGIEYLIGMLPVTDILTIMLTGTGDCAEKQWIFLGLPIPGWMLCAFIGFTVLGIFQYYRKEEPYISD